LTGKSRLTDVSSTPAAILDALGDGTRRQVFELLRDGPQSVGALAARLPVSRPAVSQHLKALKAAGLVADEADGRRRQYRVERAGVDALRHWLDEFWTDALGAFSAYVEGVEGEE
jgi:DNA-binding transcriptional ArsR family regulator